MENKEKEENIWRKIFFAEEKEKEANIWKTTMFFAEEKQKEERKGGKYLEKENIVLRRNKKLGRKGRDIFGEGKYFFRRFGLVCLVW